MNRPKVSITVPIYKAEKYLHKCIDSILSQTLKDIEVILVDDGSPDRCGEICDEYAIADSRIKVIHKTNGGSASARQVGLENSIGEYYTVCDADDWLEPSMYETLYNSASSRCADLIISGHYTNYPSGKQVENNSYHYTIQNRYIEDLMLNIAPPSTWSKLFKLDTIQKLRIEYTLGVNMGEDALFLYKFLKTPIKIIQENNSFYHYRRDLNEQTYTNNISSASVKNLAYIYKWCQTNFTSENYYKGHTNMLINLCYAAIRSENFNHTEYKQIIKNLSILNIIRYKLITKKSTLVLISSILALKYTKWINNKLYRFVYK